MRWAFGRATYGDGGSVLARSTAQDREDVLGEEGVRLGHRDQQADDELPLESEQLYSSRAANMTSVSLSLSSQTPNLNVFI